jgi:tetratricopeptide (TPR) repeat protein
VPLTCLIVLSASLWLRALPQGAGSIRHTPSQLNSLAPAFQEAVRLRNDGQFASAESAFGKVAAIAHDRGDRGTEVRALLAMGGCQLRLFEYRDAIATYSNVRRLASELGDLKLTGAALFDLSSVYLQLHNVEAASANVTEAKAIFEKAHMPDLLVKALIQIASLETEAGHGKEAKSAYQQAISICQRSNDFQSEALVEDHLGEALMEVHDLPGAKRALTDAYRIRLLQHDELLPVTQAKLAELVYLQGNAAEALRRLDDTFATKSPALKTIPRYQVIHLRGQMLAALHRDDEALDDFRQAVELASIWREGALPGEIAQTSTIAFLNSVYADCSDMEAQLAIQRHSSALAAEALLTLARNRAADLREHRTLAWQQSNRLPAQYYKILDDLRSAEAVTILSGSTGREKRTAALHARLADLQVQLGLEPRSLSEKPEKIRSQKTLTNIQRNLNDDDVLLSFGLGATRSWLWAVTRNSVFLCKLPPSSDIEQAAKAWTDRVRSGENMGPSGIALSRLLFGQLPADLWKRHHWMLVNDGPQLSGVPFAALPALSPRKRDGERSRGDAAGPAPLIAAHTIRYIASELSLADPQTPLPDNAEFVGIGDAVYNSADARLGPSFRLTSFLARPQSTSPLERLVGSGHELRSAASHFHRVQLLTGLHATSTDIAAAFDATPAVIHFAVHVISPAGKPENAALALSLGADGLPELLTPELIATYRVPGSLVVLSGCDSQRGRTVAGVGLTGLSRAWLLAGASAVVVSSWPTPDDAGAFFTAFYRHLTSAGQSTAPLPARAATALASAQLDMRAASDYRHLASFWAAYSVISKE